ncbi:MAG: hypothetical protein AAF489_17060 [Bacteroidota bacterium]
MMKYLFLTFLVLFSFVACNSDYENQNDCQTGTIENERKELLKFAKEDGYAENLHFAAAENNDAYYLAYFNPDLTSKRNQERKLLGYYRKKTKLNRTEPVEFKAELIRQDLMRYISFQYSNHREVKRHPLPGPGFDIIASASGVTEDECLQNFIESDEYRQILDYVNETCRPAFGGPCCNLTSGTFMCFDLYITPTRIACKSPNILISALAPFAMEDQN